MSIEIKKLSLDDGEDIYQMLQSIPANENGFINSANGKSYEEYKEWLVGAMQNSLQEGVIDGWRYSGLVVKTKFLTFFNELIQMVG